MSEDSSVFLEDVGDEADQQDGDTIPIDSPEESETTVPQSRPADKNTLVKPAAEAQQLKEHFEQYQAVKDAIIDPQDDVENISGQDFVTKSGMRKLATAFNLSIDTIYEGRFIENGVLKYKVKARATAPNGRSATGVGVAGAMESNFMRTLADNKDNREYAENQAVRPTEIHFVDSKWRELLPPEEVDEHSIMTTAATRAKNRSISDLVGGGDVSSEEITKEDVFD